MGNWRRILIDGTCGDEEDIKILNAELGAYQNSKKTRKSVYEDLDYDSIGPLSYSEGICALGNWAAEKMHVVGNLFERDYSPESVRSHAETLARFAPSLKIKIHCGEDWEGDKCIATITVKNGTAILGPPQINIVPPLDERVMWANMVAATMMRSL